MSALALTMALAVQSPIVDPDREALSRWTAQLESSPNDVALLDRIAFLQFQLGDTRAAIVSLERADAADRSQPKTSYTAYLRGVIADTQYDFGLARREYQQALARDPTNTSAAADLAALEKRIADVTRFARIEKALDRDLALVIVFVLSAALMGTALLKRA